MPRKKAAVVPALPATPPEQMGVAISDAISEIRSESDRETIARSVLRAETMQKLAEMRWGIARKDHRLPNGKTLDFHTYPFQKDMYLDTSPDGVMMCSTQLGKSEWLICTAAAFAGWGLRLLYVISKFDKRNKFVADRIQPALATVPLYKKMTEFAAKEGRTSDSVGLKHFGKGAINFVSSNSPQEFTSYTADMVLVDEHQDCDLDNLHMVDDRMDASDYQFKWIIGNPRNFGSVDNQNLEWRYRQTDQRKWHIPCPVCKEPQVLGWNSHIVFQEINKAGGIISCRPRDETWNPRGELDMKPVCIHCKSPMDRLSKAGLWKPMNPEEKVKHGYQVSNLYNPKRLLRDNFDRYLNAKNSPSQLTVFVNNELGEPFAMEGTSVTAAMLETASCGEMTLLDPYKFVPTNFLPWRSAL